MSDLVDRLRDRKTACKADGKIQRSWAATSLDIRAADRIDQLEAALAWIAEHTTQDSVHYSVANDALKEI